MSEKITIDDLYSDTGAFNQEAALRALKDKIVFTRENEIVFNIDPEKLKARDSILLYALAKKVLKANKKIEDETVINAEIINKTKINRNTVGGTIKRLKDKNIFMKSASGYEIPVFKVEEVLKLLSDG